MCMWLPCMCVCLLTNCAHINRGHCLFIVVVTLRTLVCFNGHVNCHVIAWNCNVNAARYFDLCVIELLSIINNTYTYIYILIQYTHIMCDICQMTGVIFRLLSAIVSPIHLFSVFVFCLLSILLHLTAILLLLLVACFCFCFCLWFVPNALCLVIVISYYSPICVCCQCWPSSFLALNLAFSKSYNANALKKVKNGSVMVYDKGILKNILAKILKRNISLFENVFVELLWLENVVLFNVVSFWVYF